MRERFGEPQVVALGIVGLNHTGNACSSASAETCDGPCSDRPDLVALAANPNTTV
jgi:hypothetical protein